jgi:glutamate racemase
LKTFDDPIGIFDSGIGGLTVVKELLKLLPDEELIYFGDTARVPYGTRSVKLIKQYSLEDATFLGQFHIKLLIVACNTASAVAVDLLKNVLTIPVTGVIEPGVEAALQSTKNHRIGIVGTTATVNSQSYQKQIKHVNSETEVFGQPCPLLVSLVEEGWIDDEITRLTVRKYFAPLIEKDVDTIILGCTHFPVIKQLIQQEVGPSIQLIDSGQETARVVRKMITDKSMLRSEPAGQPFRCYVSDIPDKFDVVGTRFLGQPVVNAQRVDFDSFLMEVGEKIYRPLNLSV